MIVPSCAQGVNTPRVLSVVARVYSEYSPDVEAATAITPAAILSTAQTARIVRARDLCAYLLVEDCGLSTVATARALGRRYHTATIKSRARIAAALPRDGNLRAALRAARVALDLQSHVPGATQMDILSPSPEVARVEHRRQQFDMASPRELAEYRYWRLRSLRMGGLR